MRTYLKFIEGKGLMLKCEGCGDQTELKAMYGPGVQERATGIDTINTHRLTEFIGRFNMIHTSCPDPK